MLSLNRTRIAIRRFRRDRRGGVFVLIAVGMLVLAGIAALIVDLGNAYSLQSRLQNAADSAALAGAAELPDVGNVTARAQEYAIKNIGPRYGQVVDNNDVVVGNWDGSARVFAAGTNPANAVQVTAKMAQENGNAAPTFLGGIFGMDTIDIGATAIATGGGSNRCVFVLEKSQKGALKVSGNATVVMDCGVAVNSASFSAFETSGNACLNSDSIEIVGGTNSSNCGNPATTGVPPVTDPLANLPPPDWWDCDYNSAMYINSDTTMYPGTYCALVKIGSTATVTMESGEYIFWGVPFTISGNSTVNGDGVTIYFTEGGGAKGTLYIAGTTTVNLKAPTTGPRQSVVFYSDRNATQKVTHRFAGGSTMDLTGIIYAPNQGIEFAGGRELTGSCVTIVARKLDFVGNTDICATNSCPDEFSNAMSNLRLVR